MYLATSRSSFVLSRVYFYLQELIIQLRKKRGSPLDLSTHINQYVRCYSSPSVPQIKIEPTNYLDVNLGLDQDDEEELDEEEEDDEDLEDEDEDDSEEEFKPNTDALRGTVISRLLTSQSDISSEMRKYIYF